MQEFNSIAFYEKHQTDLFMEIRSRIVKNLGNENYISYNMIKVFYYAVINDKSIYKVCTSCFFAQNTGNKVIHIALINIH